MDKKELEKQKGCPARQEAEERFKRTKNLQKEITIIKDISNSFVFGSRVRTLFSCANLKTICIRKSLKNNIEQIILSEKIEIIPNFMCINHDILI
jgi:hypothetical protein